MQGILCVVPHLRNSPTLLYTTIVDLCDTSPRRGEDHNPQQLLVEVATGYAEDMDRLCALTHRRCRSLAKRFALELQGHALLSNDLQGF